MACGRTRFSGQHDIVEIMELLLIFAMCVNSSVVMFLRIPYLLKIQPRVLVEKGNDV